LSISKVLIALRWSTSPLASPSGEAAKQIPGIEGGECDAGLFQGKGEGKAKGEAGEGDGEGEGEGRRGEGKVR
jgi:hypothetical protein